MWRCLSAHVTLQVIHQKNFLVFRCQNADAPTLGARFRTARMDEKQQNGTGKRDDGLDLEDIFTKHLYYRLRLISIIGATCTDPKTWISHLVISSKNFSTHSDISAGTRWARDAPRCYGLPIAP